jgi:hypothetical protein
MAKRQASPKGIEEVASELKAREGVRMYRQTRDRVPTSRFNLWPATYPSRAMRNAGSTASIGKLVTFPHVWLLTIKRVSLSVASLYPLYMPMGI